MIKDLRWTRATLSYLGDSIEVGDGLFLLGRQTRHLRVPLRELLRAAGRERVQYAGF